MMHEGKKGMGHHMKGHMGSMGGEGRMGGMMGMMGGAPIGMMGGMPCPMCGMMPMARWAKHRMGPFGIAETAKRKLLIEKVKAKLDQKYGDDLDKMADEIIEFTEEYRRMKSDYAKRRMELRSRMFEFLAGESIEETEETGEEEEA